MSASYTAPLYVGIFSYKCLDNFYSVQIVGASVLACINAQVVKIIVDIRMCLESIISV